MTGLASPRSAVASPLDVLAARLGATRERLRAEIARDGIDAQQPAVDAFVWAHAYLEAARAMSAWAASAGTERAARLARSSLDEARARIEGRDLDAAIDGDRALADLAPRSLDDVATPSDEHDMLRRSLRDFAAQEVEPHAQRIHVDDLDVPEAVIRGVARLGLLGISIPQQYGGMREATPDTTAMVVATEELSRASLGSAGSLMTRPEILVRSLLDGGTEEQRRRWLPPIADGRQMVAIAVTEPDHGSDVASIACRASRAPDGGWIIDGTKLWSTFAGRAELLMLLCRTGPDRHRGLSLFVVEKPAFAGHTFEHRQEGGGVLRGRAIPTLGYRGMHTFELAFERYHAPADALVGGPAGEGRGFYLTMKGFAVGRLQTAGRAVGVTQAALEAAVTYAAQRPLFGAREIDLALVRAKLGAMLVRTSAARQLAYAAARAFDESGDEPPSSVAKLFASRQAELVTRDAMQLHGAMGYAVESPVARHFLDARVLSIFEGAEEVLSTRLIGPALLER